MADSDQCSISIATTPRHKLPGASEESTHTTSFLATVLFNRVPKNSGLNRIVQLIEIMQLGAKPQHVGDSPPLPSVAWSLFLMTWLLLLSRLASSSVNTRA